MFEHFAVPVDRKLKEMGLNYEMRARVKSAYSIWNKMESKGVSFEDIYDIYAVRIIFDPLPGWMRRTNVGISIPLSRISTASGRTVSATG